jgi:hypothetical protein
LRISDCGLRIRNGLQLGFNPKSAIRNPKIPQCLRSEQTIGPEPTENPELSLDAESFAQAAQTSPRSAECLSGLATPVRLAARGQADSSNRTRLLSQFVANTEFAASYGPFQAIT